MSYVSDGPLAQAQEAFKHFPWGSTTPSVSNIHCSMTFYQQFPVSSKPDKREELFECLLENPGVLKFLGVALNTTVRYSHDDNECLYTPQELAKVALVSWLKNLDGKNDLVQGAKKLKNPHTGSYYYVLGYAHGMRVGIRFFTNCKIQPDLPFSHTTAVDFMMRIRFEANASEADSDERKEERRQKDIVNQLADEAITTDLTATVKQAEAIVFSAFQESEKKREQEREG